MYLLSNGENNGSFALETLLQYTVGFCGTNNFWTKDLYSLTTMQCKSKAQLPYSVQCHIPHSQESKTGTANIL